MPSLFYPIAEQFRKGGHRQLGGFGLRRISFEQSLKT